MSRFALLSNALIGPSFLLVVVFVVRNSTKPSFACDFRAVYCTGLMILAMCVGFGVALTFGTMAILDRNSADTKSQKLYLLNVASGGLIAVLSIWQLLIR